MYFAMFVIAVASAIIGSEIRDFTHRALVSLYGKFWSVDDAAHRELGYFASAFGFVGLWVSAMAGFALIMWLSVQF